MAYAFVQGIGSASWTTGKGTDANQGTGVTGAPTLAFASNNAAGNLLYAVAGTYVSGGVTMTISDTRSNTWTHQAKVLNTDGSTQLDVFYCVNCAAGANTITFSTGAVKPYWEYAALEYSGGNTPTLESSGSLNEGTIVTVHSVSTSAGITAGDLALMTYCTSGVSTFSADTGTDRAFDNFQLSIDTQENLSSPSGTYTMSTTITSGATGNAIILAFKPGSGAVTALPRSSFRQRVPVGRAAYR